MECDRGISRERSEHTGTIKHLGSIQTRNTTVFPVSRAEQESTSLATGQSWRYYSIVDELAAGCLYQRVRLIR